MRRFGFICLTVAGLLLGLVPLRADAGSAFDQQAFEAAQGTGKAILVDIAASWCPTCQVQRPIIDKLAQDLNFKEFLIFHVDFDSQKNVVRALGAHSQSTLIVFRGTKEVARSVGDTNEGSIRRLFEIAKVQ